MIKIAQVELLHGGSVYNFKISIKFIITPSITSKLFCLFFLQGFFILCSMTSISIRLQCVHFVFSLFFFSFLYKLLFTANYLCRWNDNIYISVSIDERIHSYNFTNKWFSWSHICLITITKMAICSLATYAGYFYP